MSMKMLLQVIGDGAPLVLVPGGLTGWLDWQLHVERLAGTKKVGRVQLLNVQYGLENRPLPLDYSVKTESRALAVTLDEWGLSAAVDLVAWSYGALVTLDYALDNPFKVRSLILIEPPAYWVLRALGVLDAEAKQASDITFNVQDEISESQLEQFLWKIGLCSSSQSARKLPQWSLLTQHRNSLRSVFAVSKHDDDLKRLRAFQRPVLLVKGTGSLRPLHQIIDMLATQLPRVQVVEMPGGHTPQIVSLDLFMERMKDFQASVPD